MSEPLANAVLGGGAAIPVEVHAIGKELRRLWESAEKPGVLTRACTRNLVALCQDEGEAERATAIVAELSARHAVRAFVVTAVADAPDTLEAFLSAHCSLRGGGRHVCCEQVTLRVGSAARRRAAAAMLPLLVPDLPVVAWAVGDLEWEDACLDALLEVSDRMLVDSRRLRDPLGALEDMAGGEREDEWSPGDFEWARLAPWREAVAMLFESGAGAPTPTSVACVTVEHGEGAPPIGPALLAGWIADRIAVVSEAAAIGLRARVEAGDAAGEDTVLDVRLHAISGATPGVCGVVVRTDRGVDLRVERKREDGPLRVPLPGAGPDDVSVSRSMPCDIDNEAALLGDLLDRHGHDAMYERALARAATLLAGTPPDQ
jgi:glucose-6-phosphate dehydrogenase assembly protein OpcA